jgi:flavin-dependent dehydrogenase
MGDGSRVVTDVVVVGAGPAGSVYATRMVQLGFDVCVIERSRFPRPRLGESLSPGVMPLLASAGLSATVEATAVRRVRSVTVQWDGAPTIRHDPREQGRLVDRGAFDAALLERAQDIGTRVLQPAAVRHCTANSDGWHLTVDTVTGSVGIQAAFMVDATGRSGRFRRGRRVVAPRTIAIHGYWIGPDLPRQPRIAAGDREWYWGVPIPDGSYNTLVFVDGERFREEPAASIDERLCSLLARSALSSDVRGARLRAPARAADATPYVLDDCVGERRISIGDAALALDPLSSSGVQKAIQTALSGAIVTNTLLRRPEASPSAIRFFRDSVQDAGDRHHAWAMAHYATAAASRPDTFWADRAGATREAREAASGSLPAVDDDVPLRLSPRSRWEELPCLGAQYVEIRTALRHPQLEGPVAFLGGQELAPLLRDAPPGLTTRQLADAWSSRMSSVAALSIVRWLSGHGVLERVSSGGAMG